MFFTNKFKKIEDLGNKGNIEKLSKLFTDNDPEIRCAVAKALGKIKNDESINMLISALRDPEPKVRAGSAAALGEIKDIRAAEHMRHQLERESDSSVISSIEQAMKCLVRN